MHQRPRLGILILQSDPWEAIVERVRRYEGFGFDSVWLADHFVNPWHPSGSWFEGWTLLAGLAARTSRIHLGPLVTHVVYRHPAVIARQAMTVDHIAGGRLELGIGAGASGYDASMTGSPWWPAAERIRRFHEAVEIVDRLLSGEPTSFEGHYYRVTNAVMQPGPVRRPRPRLTIAACGPTMVKLAARYADVWNTEGAYEELYDVGASPDDVLRLTRQRSELLNEQAAALGRDPHAIARSFLAGFGAAPEHPWASVGAFDDFIGRYGEIGFTEFIFPEPSAEETPTFEHIVQDGLREPAVLSTGTERFSSVIPTIRHRGCDRDDVLDPIAAFA